MCMHLVLCKSIIIMYIQWDIEKGRKRHWGLLSCGGWRRPTGRNVPQSFISPATCKISAHSIYSILILDFLYKVCGVYRTTFVSLTQRSSTFTDQRVCMRVCGDSPIELKNYAERSNWSYTPGYSYSPDNLCEGAGPLARPESISAAII